MELTALASLKRNVKFWIEQCGCNEKQIIANINGWYNFAYSPSEQEKAKEEILKIFMK
ncbi:hypothetical protein K8Y78_004286 [Salmonella enterica]|nr:hypothetical protein [Salmonella enterica]